MTQNKNTNLPRLFFVSRSLTPPRAFMQLFFSVALQRARTQQQEPADVGGINVVATRFGGARFGHGSPAPRSPAPISSCTTSVDPSSKQKTKGGGKRGGAKGQVLVEAGLLRGGAYARPPLRNFAAPIFRFLPFRFRARTTAPARRRH